MVPYHDTSEHRGIGELAEDTAGDGGICVAGDGSDIASREADMDLSVAAGGVGQECLPGGVVEARVDGAVDVDQVTLQVVVELNPEAVELYVLQKVHHVLAAVEGTLGRGGDNIGASRGCD